MKIGIRLLVKKRGSSIQLRQLRQVTQAVTLLGIAFNEVKEDKEAPRKAIQAFLLEWFSRIELIEKVKQYFRDNFGRSELQENIEIALTRTVVQAS